METVIPSDVQDQIIKLFKEGKTVREMEDATKYDKKDILLFLTGSGLWSKYCSTCVLKRCFDCPGLEELGKPLGAQDQIDLLANLKREV